MIWARLVFGGFGRRGLEAIVAVGVLAVAAAIVAGAMMVIEGAKGAIARAEREDRPDIVQVKSRFNRAVFETPRSGNLPPLTLPVYEPLIDPEKLSAAGGSVVARQSLLRNVVAVVVGMALAAVALGMAPTAWWLHRRSVAGALSEEGR
jgi:sulfite exporter TauE/SafE